jgi:hypothetical protein
MFWAIVVGSVVVYLGIGVVVSRFLMKPWITKEFGVYKISTACLNGLFWPIALATDFLVEGVCLLGKMFGGEEDDDDDTNGTQVE